MKQYKIIFGLLCLALCACTSLKGGHPFRRTSPRVKYKRKRVATRTRYHETEKGVVVRTKGSQTKKAAAAGAEGGETKKAAATGAEGGETKKAAATGAEGGETKKAAAAGAKGGQTKKAAAAGAEGGHTKKAAAAGAEGGHTKKAAAAGAEGGETKKAAAAGAEGGKTEKKGKDEARTRRDHTAMEKEFMSHIRHGMTPEEASVFLDVHGLDVDGVDENDRTALHHSTIAGNYEMARFLCKKKANPHLPDRFKKVPIMYTSRTEMVKILIEECRSSVNVKNKNGESLLMLAVMHNFPIMVKLLIGYKADPHIHPNKGKYAGLTPFAVALKLHNEFRDAEEQWANEEIIETLKGYTKDWKNRRRR